VRVLQRTDAANWVHVWRATGTSDQGGVFTRARASSVCVRASAERARSGPSASVSRVPDRIWVRLFVTYSQILRSWSCGYSAARGHIGLWG